MSDGVTPIHGGVIVAALEQALARARAGDMRAVVIVADEGDGTTFNRFAYCAGWSAVTMLGVLAMLEHRIAAEEWAALDDDAG